MKSTGLGEIMSGGGGATQKWTRTHSIILTYGSTQSFLDMFISALCPVLLEPKKESLREPERRARERWRARVSPPPSLEAAMWPAIFSNGCAIHPFLPQTQGLAPNLHFPIY